jgi:hypothetical protein
MGYFLGRLVWKLIHLIYCQQEDVTGAPGGFGTLLLSVKINIDIFPEMTPIQTSEYIMLYRVCNIKRNPKYNSIWKLVVG